MRSRSKARAGRSFFGLVGVLVALATAPAAAHAVLLESEPATGAQLGRSPAVVTLRFDEPVETSLGAIRVLDDAGTDRERGPAFHPGGDGTLVAVRTPALPRGRYVVAWQVVSVDSHIVGGAYPFGVGVPAGDVPPALVRDVVPGAFPLLAAVAFVLLVALVTAVGLWLGERLVVRPGGALPPSMLEFAVWAVLAFVAPAEILLQAELTGGSPATVAVTRFGLLRLLLALAAIGGVAAVALGRRGWALGTCAALALVAEALSGHAATGPQPVLGTLADLAHLGAAAAWIGALLVTLRAPAAVDLRRTSALATAGVAVLVASGVLQAWRTVGSFSALVTTGYGALVCAKIALLLAALAFALGSRRGLVHGGATRAARFVRAELIVLAIVLAVTGALVESPPARDGAAASVARATFALDGVTVAIATFRGAGATRTIEVRTTAGGAPRDVDEVTASAAEAQRGVGPLAVPLRRAGPGLYRGEFSPPFPGAWRLVVRARIGEFDEDGTSLAI